MKLNAARTPGREKPVRVIRNLQRSGLLVVGLCAMTMGGTAQQPQKTSAAPRVQYRETSVTLHQAVAAQEQNYNRMKTGQGTVVWQEVTRNGPPAARVIYFAFEPERSVTLVLPQSEARAYAASQGKVDWSKALAAHLRVGDLVQRVSAGTTGTQPQVRTVPFNPAVHERNPLVAFHPRILADDVVALRDLAAALPGMKARPQMSQFMVDAQLMIRVDFLNPKAPGEELYYILDPAKAYLPVEIGRRSQGKLLALTKLVIGNTKDKTWVPARRDKTTYDTTGQVLSREHWYYQFLSLNEGIPPQATSLLFFQLPEGTAVDVQIPPKGHPAGAGVGGVNPMPGSPPVPRSSPTPQPTRGMRRYL